MAWHADSVVGIRIGEEGMTELNEEAILDKSSVGQFEVVELNAGFRIETQKEHF